MLGEKFKRIPISVDALGGFREAAQPAWRETDLFKTGWLERSAAFLDLFRKSGGGGTPVKRAEAGSVLFATDREKKQDSNPEYSFGSQRGHQLRRAG